MAVGTSLLLIAVGAVLAFAVSYQTSGIDIQVVGDILLIVGIIGLLFSLIFLAGWFSIAPRDHIDDYGPGHPRDL